MRWLSGVVLAGTLLSVACAVQSPSSPSPGGGGGPLPTPTPMPTPMPTPAPTPIPTRFEETFATTPLGGQPADFVDERTEVDQASPSAYPWLYAGEWKVVDATGSVTGPAFQQAQEAQQPYLTFQRFTGGVFGMTDGMLPPHYRAQITQQPIASPYNLPPTGDQGVQFFYRDPTHYVEVVTTPSALQLWVCDGGVPESSEGWTQVWEMPLTTNPGDARRIGAEVDTLTHTFTVLYNGAPQYTATLPQVDESAPHGLALRSTGNIVNFSDLVLEWLK